MNLMFEFEKCILDLFHPTDELLTVKTAVKSKKLENRLNFIPLFLVHLIVI